MSEPSKTGSPQIDFILAKERYLKDISLAWERYENELRLANERFDRDVNNRNLTATPENCKLVFRNKISQDILTGELIQGIEVALVDCNTGDVIVAGLHASLSVKIVVVKGEFDDDWTTEEFDENIREMQGNKPLLLGDVRLKLKRGVAVANNIKFHNDTIKMKPAVFRLGARVVTKCEGIRIKEAITESFAVKDYRNKYSEKREIPALKDEVWRLKGIQKGGKVYKRLQELEICTVEDFVIRLVIDPERLKKLIDDAVTLPKTKWEVTLEHARNCQPDNRMYCYMNFQQKTGVIFKIWEQVLGLYILGLRKDGQYAPLNILAEHDKDEAKMNLASAFEHWGNIVCADDADSLEQRVTNLLNANAHMFPELSCFPSGDDTVGTVSEITTNTSWIMDADAHDMEPMFDAQTNFSPFPDQINLFCQLEKYIPNQNEDGNMLFEFTDFDKQIFATGIHETQVQNHNEYYDMQQLSLHKSCPADEISSAVLPEAPVQNHDESYEMLLDKSCPDEVSVAPIQNLYMKPQDESCPGDEISGKGVPGARRRWKRKLFCLARFLYVSVKDRVSANGDHRPNKMQKVMVQ